MRSFRRPAFALAAAVTAAACGDGAGPAKRTPALVTVLTAPPASATVGQAAGVMSVKVTDAAGDPVPGTVVTFAVTRGAGRVTPAADTANADGTAATALTVGSTPGTNEVTAVVGGVPTVKVSVTGVAGATRLIVLAPRFARLSPTQDSTLISATPRDSFNNNTGAAVAWTSRNPALVTAAAGAGSVGIVTAVSRPGQTYVVATSEGARDSVLVDVQSAGASPCTAVATPNVITVGSALAFDAGAACIRSDVTGAEYALVAHYNTTVTTVTTGVNILGTGIVAPSSPFPMPPAGIVTPADATRDLTFEWGLRRRERQEINARVSGARAWHAANRGASPAASRSAIPATAHEGDLINLNVNAFDFCDKPQMRTARIVALTDGAVVMADVSNPAGGFTDAEYRAFGIAMDTLVNPVDTAAFGAPSDIDGNQRVGILFTSAVNALTQRGSSGVVLGFYYARDLLPKLSGAGACPGSNVAEMFYLLVPDINAVVSDPRSKGFVQVNAIGTIAHEYQHLINASRRMYVNNAPSVDEEVWLNEGLSHIAEELVFYKTSQRAPRQNIGAAQLANGTLARTMFDSYQRSNIARYQSFLSAPDANSPIVANDFIATRGATWSFLRYLADRARVTDGDFWFRLVNSTKTGALNLDDVLGGSGLTTLTGMRDWSTSVLADEVAGSLLQQPSWNFVSVIPAVLQVSFGLTPAAIQDGVTTNLLLRSGGTVYRRFGVPLNQEALLLVTGTGGGAPSPGVRLTIVRIK